MTKYFVLRPHVLLSSYDCLLRFGEDNTIVVPMAVIDEVANMKDLSLEKAKIRKHVLEYIRSLLDKGILSDDGCVQENGSILKVATNYNGVEVTLPNITEFQKRTLQVCKGIQKELEEKSKRKKNKPQVILVTNNIALQMKASTIGIQAESFKDEVFPTLSEQYSGRVYLQVSNEVMAKIKGDPHKIPISEVEGASEKDWLENCYVIMTCGDGRNSPVYTQVRNNEFVELTHYIKRPYEICPKNDGQKLLMDALISDTPLVIVKGPAGTGKTLLSLATSLQRYDAGDFKKILITRQVSNNTLGYLPGDVDEKMCPFLKGVKDNLDIIINGTSRTQDNEYTVTRGKCRGSKTPEKENGHYFFEQGTIVIEALEMLRGRSIVDTFFIIDETQNIDPEFIKTIVTRIAQGSKFVFLGDPTQIDNPKLTERYNGLVYLAEKMKGDEDCTIVTLVDNESVRSRVARTASWKL